MQNVTSQSFKKFKKIPLFLAVLLLGLSSFGVVFVWGRIQENKIIAEETRAEWQKEEARRYEIRSLGIFLKEADAEIQELDSHFARQSNVVPFLDSVQAMARTAGAEAEIISVDAAPEGSGLLVSARASGEFGALYKFLELLENSPYELAFESADIGKNKGDGGGWQLFLRLKLLSYLP